MQGIKQMRLTRGANVFHTLRERVSDVQQMRLQFHVHTFQTRSKRIYPFMHTRFTHKALIHCFVGTHFTQEEHVHVFMPSSSHEFFQEESTYVLNAGSLRLCGTTYLLFLWSTHGLLCL